MSLVWGGPDLHTRTERDSAAYDRAHAAEPDFDVPDVDDEIPPLCDECLDTGWVSVPCPRDPECSGCDACDQRCLSCETGRVA